MNLQKTILLLVGLAVLYLFMKGKASATGLYHWTLTHPSLAGSYDYVANSAAEAILQAEAEFGIVGGWNAVKGAPA